MRKQTKAAGESGFTLIEILVVMAVMTIIMAVVFSAVDSLTKRYRTEESKLDLTQGAREMMDQIARDLHIAGYPGRKMYAPGTLMAGAELSDARVSAGLVSLSNTELWFEGDLDGDGNVDSIRYRLDWNDPDNPGNCPCRIQRSQVVKVNGTEPWNQGQNYATVLGGVINSGGSGGGAPNGSRNIAGNSNFSGNVVANDVVYADYRPAPLFTAFDRNGTAVPLPLDISTAAGVTAMRNIHTIRISMNTLSEVADMQTGMRPALSITATARIKNH